MKSGTWNWATRPRLATCGVSLPLSVCQMILCLEHLEARLSTPSLRVASGGTDGGRTQSVASPLMAQAATAVTLPFVGLPKPVRQYELRTLSPNWSYRTLCHSQ